MGMNKEIPTPRGWEKGTWQKIEQIAERITKEELLDFYRKTGSIRSDTLEQWSRDELIGVLDEIGKENADQFLRMFKHYID